jgi:uncharacterized membrane protein
MSGELARSLSVIGAVGAGLTGGVYFAFSTFVMRALGRLPPSDGLAAMQAINRAAPNPLFMTAIFGTALVCAWLAVSAASHLDQPAARLQLAGSVLYVVGVVLTVAYHVPRNHALALVDPAGPAAAEAWRDYLGAWTAANHVRAISSLSGAVVLTLGLVASGRVA